MTGKTPIIKCLKKNIKNTYYYLTNPKKLLSFYNPDINWDKEYKNDEWSHLNKLDERSRYSVIIGEIEHLKPNEPSVLDLGCGEALLLRRSNFFGCYTGIDISSEALKQARPHIMHNDFTLVAYDIETYSPERNYDFIIFNEILCYLRDPVAAIIRYSKNLADSGHIICSISTKNFLTITALIQGLKSFGLKLADQINITNMLSSKTWNILIFNKRD